VVDAVRLIRASRPPSPPVRRLLQQLATQRIVLLTTHRRESLGPLMRSRLQVLREFVSAHPDVELIFPVHPNPMVGMMAQAELATIARVHLLAPLDYPDFLHCLSAAWLVLSDSGGIQEEAPTLGKALLVLRANTERPEALACRVARLVGDHPDDLRRELMAAAADDGWVRAVRPVDNPFGRGDSAGRIADGIADFFASAPAVRGARAAQPGAAS
jgi:UDP-N-acetylglucosamine 2-epimerase (non-hydrolysing)